AELSHAVPGQNSRFRARHARVREVHDSDRERGDEQAVKALALIDGEHYPDVLRVAFAGLEHDVAGAVLLGGTEKLRGGEDYGVPVFDTLDEAFEAVCPEIVLDLSHEPIRDPP